MRSLIGEKADPVTIPQWLSPSIHDGTGYRSKWVPILSVGAGEEDDAGRRRLRRPSFEVPHHTNGRRKRPYKSSMLFTRKTAIVQQKNSHSVTYNRWLRIGLRTGYRARYCSYMRAYTAPFCCCGSVRSMTRTVASQA